MKKILILTDKEDAHGRLAFCALNTKGVLAVRWDSKDFLINQKVNISLNTNQTFRIIDESAVIEVNEIDVVWFRRPSLPHIPETVHPGDINFLQRESVCFMRSLWSVIGETATWVNPFSSFYIANSKVFQLREASKIGLSIPMTLISNDNSEIREFINQNHATGVIYKAFMPATWKENDSVFCSQTVVLISDMLPNQDTLQLTPGIYQSQVPKAYEIRATFFNDHCIAVKIENQSMVDWRTLFFKKQVPLSETTLPTIIQIQCVKLMKRLGIIFGCFDFIVTPSGEYVFLEVNEMGQFLWIEENLPKLRLLDTFCDFLISMANMKNYYQYDPPVSLAGIENDKFYKDLLVSDTVNHMI